jgi:hypothetical protein
MEKIPGNVLDWNGATESQKSKIMEQLAGVFLEMEQHPYSNIGSPLLERVEDGMNATVAGYAQPQLFASANASPLGPFSTVKDALEAIIRLQLRLISSGEVSALPRQLSCEPPEARNDTSIVLDTQH